MNRPGMPKLVDAYFTERSGIFNVARLVNAMRCIWRETINTDIGIDGQIENVDDNGYATGHVVAVQVKSGKSYIKTDGTFLFYQPPEKHLRYWEGFPLPVILIVYDPDLDIAYWVDARQQLRSRMATSTDIIRVPISQVVDEQHKAALFQTSGAFDATVLPIAEVLRAMINSKSGNVLFDLSFFDIFVFGLTDLCRKLFFSMSLCMQIVELKLDLGDSEEGSSVSINEYDFLDAYVRFLVSQNLILFDFSDYLVDLEILQTVPIFIFPLTSRGAQLIRHIRDIHDELSEKRLCRQTGPFVSERIMEMIPRPYDSAHLMHLAEFQTAYLSKFARAQ